MIIRQKVVFLYNILRLSKGKEESLFKDEEIESWILCEVYRSRSLIILHLVEMTRLQNSDSVGHLIMNSNSRVFDSTALSLY